MLFLLGVGALVGATSFFLLRLGMLHNAVGITRLAMLSVGAAPISIILTTFIVNLRHVLMSSSLAVYLHGASAWFLSIFAYGVTDESFAVNLVKFREGSWHRHQAWPSTRWLILPG